MGLFAIGYGVVRAVLLFGVVAAFFGLHLPDANYVAALVLLIIASISFIGIGMMTAVLPLISPEKGTQLGFVAQGLLLVVSGVYYPVSVLPQWMQWLSVISPATYALRGCRAAIINGAGMSDLTTEIWALFLIGAISVPLGPVHLPHRRALRQEAREAEAVGMIRAVAGDADLELCARICGAVEEVAPTAEQLRAVEDRLLLDPDGGYAYVNHSSVVGSAYAMVRVLPERRRAGIGSALVEAAAASARELGHDVGLGLRARR